MTCTLHHVLVKIATANAADPAMASLNARPAAVLNVPWVMDVVDHRASSHLRTTATAFARASAKQVDNMTLFWDSQLLPTQMIYKYVQSSPQHCRGVLSMFLLEVTVLRKINWVICWGLRRSSSVTEDFSLSVRQKILTSRAERSAMPCSPSAAAALQATIEFML